MVWCGGGGRGVRRLNFFRVHYRTGLGEVSSRHDSTALSALSAQHRFEEDEAGAQQR